MTISVRPRVISPTFANLMNDDYTPMYIHI